MGLEQELAKILLPYMEQERGRTYGVGYKHDATGVPNASRSKMSAQSRQRAPNSHALASAFELDSQALFIIPPWLMDDDRPAVSVFARADKSPAPLASVAA